MKLTKQQAGEWVMMHADSDPMDSEELEAVFAATFGRPADDIDREQGLWSLLCSAEDRAETDPMKPESSFAPGPWSVSFESIDPEWSVVIAANGAIVANVNSGGRKSANARLIAASPDLLTALRDLAAAAARIVEDDDKPTAVHMRELNRSRQRAIEISGKATGNGGKL